MLLIRSWYFVICGLYVVDILLLICCWYVVCILLICGWYVVDMLLVCGWYVSGMWLICCRHVVGMLFTKQTNHKPSRESGPSRPVPPSTTSWCGLGWTCTGYQWGTWDLRLKRCFSPPTSPLATEDLWIICPVLSHIRVVYQSPMVGCTASTDLY